MIFATDDTPVMNSIDFMEPFLNVKGCKVLNIRIPYFLIYMLFYFLETILMILRPIYPFNMETGLRSMIYVNTSLYFNNRKSKQALGFEAPYTWEQSKEISLEYYKNTDI